MSVADGAVVDDAAGGRPFVDRPVPDRERAAATAAAAAADWGLDEPRLLRHGMNSLYRCGDVVLRVGAATAPAATAHDLATRLLDHGIATVPPVEGLTLDADGLAVTGWRLVRETRQAIDWAAVGAIVRRVHDLGSALVPNDYPLADPTAFAWWDFATMLDDVADEIDPPARDAIISTVRRHDAWRSLVGRDSVVCHGDVHPGNVLMSSNGPLLIDWDLMCRAHPAWDHAMLATYTERWGGAPGAYDRFVAGYGPPPDRDVTLALADLRNVAATLMRVRAGRSDPAAAAEAAERLRYWRGEPDAPVWRAQ